MDRGRAEIHLRLVAEAELRRATARPRDGAAAPPDLPPAGDGVETEEAVAGCSASARVGSSVSVVAVSGAVELAPSFPTPSSVIRDDPSGAFFPSWTTVGS